METLGVNAAAYELSNSSHVMCILLPLESTAAASVSQPVILSLLERSLRLRKGPRSPCLRKMSAYNGGFKEDTQWSIGDSESYSEIYSAKKRRALTFADQHGRPLIQEKLFRQCEPSIQCRGDSDDVLKGGDSVPSAVASAGATAVAQVVSTRSPHHEDCDPDRLDKWWLLHNSLTQQELLSMCLVSCSFLGCVLVGYRHFINITNPTIASSAAATATTTGSSGGNVIDRQCTVKLVPATKWYSRL